MSAAPVAAPVAPPKSWFADPGLKALAPITVEKDGRVYGHVASWSACHSESTALGETCVRAPRSRTGYANFHLGTITTAEGDDVAVGHLIAGAPHSDPVWGLDATLVHYSHSGWVGADVRAGEDRFGIWVAGALRPDISPAQLRALKSSPLSGDWRTDPETHQLEMVAVLAVNSPGFRVPRPSALIASQGTVSSMFAIGSVAVQEADGDQRRRALRLKVLNLQAHGDLPMTRPKPVRTLQEIVARVDEFRARSLVASMGAPGADVIPWSGTLGFEGVPTGDGRLIVADALTTGQLPMPLRWSAVDNGGHDGAVIVGLIDTVSRDADGAINGSGVIDLGSPAGREAARLIAGGFLSGVSFDLDSAEEQVSMSDLKTDEDGPTPDLVLESARVRAATLVAIPAFDGARIQLAAPYQPGSVDCGCDADDFPEPIPADALETR